MIAADRDAGIKYAWKTGHLSIGGPRASTPGRWDTPEQRAPECPHLEDETRRHRGPTASTPERQDTSAQGLQDMHVWKTGQATSARRGLRVSTPAGRMPLHRVALWPSAGHVVWHQRMNRSSFGGSSWPQGSGCGHQPVHRFQSQVLSTAPPGP